MPDRKAHPWRGVALGLVMTLSMGASSILLAEPAAAQSTIVVTEAQVVGFIASYPEIKALAVELGEENSASGGGGDDVVAGLGALMAHQDAIGRLDATVAAHGFASYMEWITVAGSISTAYVFATEGGAMDAQLQAAIDAIRADPNMTEAQKQVLVQQMEAAVTSIGAAEPPQETIDVVNAHAGELKLVFDQM